MAAVHKAERITRMAKKMKLPDIVYVCIEDEGDDAYLMAYKEMKGAAKWMGKKLVGIYHLESLVNISLEVKAEQAK